MNKATYILAFTLGAAAGSLLTWKVINEKYKKITEEEIESVKEHYKKKNELVSIEFEEDADSSDDTKVEYEEYLNDLNYTVDTNEDDTVAPYVISPEEFGEKTGFETTSWTYYADGILTDESDEIVGDPESFIGDGLEHFGDFDDDSVYIRNENEKCDYEILKHTEPFNDNAEGAY